MKKFIVEVISGDVRQVITVEAPTIEEARAKAIKLHKDAFPATDWTTASSAEITSDSTHTS